MKQAIGDAVSVRFFMPSPALAPYITTYYLVETRLPDGEATVEDWLHPEWGNLRLCRQPHWQAAIGAAPLVDAPRMIASGPTSTCAHFTMRRGRCWGIGLLPAGWARFVDAPADAHADSFCDASRVPDFAALSGLIECLGDDPPDPAAEAARFDAYLCDLLERRPQPALEERIQQAHALLVNHEVASVADMAGRLAMSSRSLERFSLKAFGFSPKLLLRRQRFLRSLAQFMLDPTLAWIKTLDWHYVDQAHFVRDFKRFMTMSPSAYAALDHPVLRAAAQARAAATGQAVQVLHRP